MELRKGQENILKGKSCYPVILTFPVKGGIEDRQDTLGKVKRGQGKR